MQETIELQKNKSEVIRIESGEYRGHKLCSIRVWARNRSPDKSQPEFLPTKKGIAFRLGLVPQLIEALERVTGLEAQRSAARPDPF